MIKIKIKTKMITFPQMMIKIPKNTMKMMKGERETVVNMHLETKILMNRIKDQMIEIRMIMIKKITNTIIMLTMKGKEIALTKIVIESIEGTTTLRLSLKYLLLKLIEKL